MVFIWFHISRNVHQVLNIGNFVFWQIFAPLGAPRESECVGQIYSWNVILIKFFCFGQISPTFWSHKIEKEIPGYHPFLICENLRDLKILNVKMKRFWAFLIAIFVYFGSNRYVAKLMEWCLFFLLKTSVSCFVATFDKIFLSMIIVGY